MEKIRFKKTENGNNWVEALDDKYLLLDYFISTYRFQNDLNIIIGDLKDVYNEDKVFEDIQDSQVIWNFGDDGEFECDKNTAYFSSISDPDSSLEVPLKEVITLLEAWSLFLTQD